MKYRIGVAAALLLGLILSVIFGLTGAAYAHRIIPGVKVGSIDLGGLTREQAQLELAALAGDIAGADMGLKSGDQHCRLQAGALGLGLDAAATAQRALQAGQTGSLWHKLQERRRIKARGLALEPVLQVERTVLEKRIQREFGEIMIEPLDAGFKISRQDQVEIVPGRTGQTVDYDALVSAMLAACSGLAPGSQELELELPLVAVPPRRTAAEIEQMGISGLIAQFSTTFNPQQWGRTYNVKVAAAALDGLLVAPQEEISFNRLVGPRSSEAGYKSALVIVDNEFVEGIGGGVCQVSSTLYNAVLLAGLTVTERSNHSLPVSYVPLGRDATVVYDALDFKFSNNRTGYIYIKSYLRDDELTFKIYGPREGFPRIELASRVVEEIAPRVIYENDPHLARGEQVVKQQGAKGYRVAATRTIWQNGRPVNEDLPLSLYRSVPQIIARGTGTVQPAVIVPPQDLSGLPQPEGDGPQPHADPREEGAGQPSPGGQALEQQTPSPAEPGEGTPWPEEEHTGAADAKPAQEQAR